MGSITVLLPPKSVPLSWTPSQVMVRKPPLCGDGVAPLLTPPMAALNAVNAWLALPIVVRESPEAD